MTIVKMVDDAAKKVLAEGFAGEYEEGDDWAEEEEVPQHVIDENRADLIRERRKELAQIEMYDDP